METLTIAEEKNWHYRYEEYPRSDLIMVERFKKTFKDKEYEIYLRKVDKEHEFQKEFNSEKYQVILSFWTDKNSTIICKHKVSQFYEFLNVPHIHANKLTGPMYSFETIVEAYEFIEEVINSVDELKLE